MICLTTYQRTISLDHGPLRHIRPVPICRFTPTCSEYAMGAINAHGWTGLVMAARRLLRCHPFTKGGLDPVPPLIKQERKITE